jgi:hypothetical protein
VASVDAKKVQRYIYPDRDGVHRCATFGDFPERIEDFATFIGYTVIEEDFWRIIPGARLRSGGQATTRLPSQ